MKGSFATGLFYIVLVSWLFNSLTVSAQNFTTIALPSSESMVQPTLAPSSLLSAFGDATNRPTADSANATDPQESPTPVPNQYPKPYRPSKDKEEEEEVHELSIGSKIQVFLLSFGIFLALFFLNRSYHRSNRELEALRRQQQERRQQFLQEQEEEMQVHRKQLLTQRFHFTTIPEDGGSNNASLLFHHKTDAIKHPKQNTTGVASLGKSANKLIGTDESIKKKITESNEASDVASANHAHVEIELEDIERSPGGTNTSMATMEETEDPESDISVAYDKKAAQNDDEKLEKAKAGGDHDIEEQKEQLQEDPKETSSNWNSSVQSNKATASSEARSGSIFGGFWKKHQSNSNTECSICLDTYRPGETICVAKNQSCNHVFHHDCIAEWLKKRDRCPLCRVDLMSAC